MRGRKTGYRLLKTKYKRRVLGATKKDGMKNTYIRRQFELQPYPECHTGKMIEFVEPLPAYGRVKN